MQQHVPAIMIAVALAASQAEAQMQPPISVPPDLPYSLRQSLLFNDTLRLQAEMSHAMEMEAIRAEQRRFQRRQEEALRAMEFERIRAEHLGQQQHSRETIKHLLAPDPPPAKPVEEPPQRRNAIQDLLDPVLRFQQR